MKTALVAILTLSCTAAYADVYRCPAAYPGKDAAALPLTGAMMMFGERPGNGLPFPSGWDTPSDLEVEGGMDQHYELPENEQGWLICEYGSRQRVKGRIRNGHEYGQAMEHYGQQSWFIKLAPRDASCTVHIRETRFNDTNKRIWTVSATCMRQ
ncbi:hypothetical protein [Massilia sp.]|uniref:hypothetical protein n=1 Tax=Massilia sp. TaxID=1882437 RepID=UPI00352D9EF4